MNRAEIAKRLLLENIGKRVTLRMLANAGLEFYTARNAVSEAWVSMRFEGCWRLTQKMHKKSRGENVGDNGWILEKISGADAQADNAVEGKPGTPAAGNLAATDKRLFGGEEADASASSPFHPSAPVQIQLPFL